ncbi:ionotropic receptor 25a-like [Chelonus insularis]|uniref:ionotropic receptor 25a-like n=1 Tax=Chelonus insularis TaxID=460826 RepID=UPI001588E940|nr:ionotropic receptor 25a-like [Chelonus insularis]
MKPLEIIFILITTAGILSIHAQEGSPAPDQASDTFSTDSAQSDGSISDQPQEEPSTIPPAPSRPINLFIINEALNEQAEKSVSNAIKEIKGKNPDWIGKVISIAISSSDSNEILAEICGVWDQAVRAGGPDVPDLVLDTTLSGTVGEVVTAFTKAVGIPTLSAQFGERDDLRNWRDLSPEAMKYLIQIRPPADMIPDAVRHMSSDMNISNAAIIFDQHFVMDHKYKSLLLNVPTRHVIVKAKEYGPPMTDQMKQLRNLDIVNFFILGGEKTIADELATANQLGFTGPKYGWYALTLDHEFTPQCNCENLTVLFFKSQATVQNQQQLGELTARGLLSLPVLTSAFYYDLVRVGVEAMRLAVIDNMWPSEPPHIVCDEYSGSNTPSRKINFLSKLKEVTSKSTFVPTFAGFHWDSENGNHHAQFNMDIRLTTINNGNPDSTLNVGTWPVGIGSKLQIVPEYFKTVSSHTAVTSFRVVTVQVAPFVEYNNETGQWFGYCIDLLEEIREIIGFEYEIYEPDDGEFGTYNESSNTWSGIIGELIAKRADIAVGTLSVMAERENVVDFTVPYYDLVGLSILMLKPKAPTSLFKFLTVLEDDVWLCILASYFFTSFLMWIFDRWSPYSYQNNKEKYKDDDEKRNFDLKECLWFCMTSLTPQGGGEAPKNLSGRLVAATWWLFGFIIIASYTANLAAFLTVSRLETPVESLDDLSKQYKIQYAPMKPSEAYTYFQRMSDIERRFYEIWKDMSLNDSLSDVERAKLAVWDYPVSDRYTKMFQAMDEAGFPRSKEIAISRVRRLQPDKSESEFAFIGDATEIRYLAMTTCDLIMVGDEFSRKPYALAVQQGSPLKDQLNNAILRLLNQRKLEKLKNKWWNKNPNKKECEKEDDQSDGISIQNIGGVFIVIFVGIILACMTLAFEYWYYRYRPQMQEKKRQQMTKGSSQEVKPIKFTLKPRAAFQTNSEFRSRF